MEKANSFHSAIKFTAEMSETEITFLGTKCTNGLDSTRNQPETGEQIINQPGAHEPNGSLSQTLHNLQA